MKIKAQILKKPQYKVTQEIKTLLNPNCFVPDEILELTGINRAQLESSPTFGQIKKDVLETLEDCILVAHNARFDYSFLRNEFKREEITFKQKHLCTVKLSRVLFPEHSHHNLDSLIERFGFKCKNRHRAFDYADVLWQFFQYLLKKIPEEKLLEALAKVLKKPSIPINLKPEILDNLPESAGVYIFYGQKGMPLYIGKSVNIRDRVLSHFSSDYLSPTEMRITQQTESIEVIQTAGELGALLTEASLIKKMQPLYNRKLRNSRLMLTLKQKQNKDNYFTVVLEAADQLDAKDLDQVLGIFKSKKSAQQFLTYLVKEHELCSKLLGVENTNSTCFNYRLGKCKGACVKKEIVAKYNLRFLEAFSKTKLRPWPFNGPIVVSERDKLEERTDEFLIDKWMFLGKIKNPHSEQSEESLADARCLRLAETCLPARQESFTSVQDDIGFDVDTYKILLSYLYQAKNQKNIKPFIKKTIEQPIYPEDQYFELF